MATESQLMRSQTSTS